MNWNLPRLRLSLSPTLLTRCHLRALLRDPSPTDVAAAGVVLVMVGGLAVLAKRRFRPEPERNP